MTNYKKLYFTLFNGITMVTEQLEQFRELLPETMSNTNLEHCISDLKRFQIETEEMFLAESSECH